MSACKSECRPLLDPSRKHCCQAVAAHIAVGVRLAWMPRVLLAARLLLPTFLKARLPLRCAAPMKQQCVRRACSCSGITRKHYLQAASLLKQRQKSGDQHLQELLRIGHTWWMATGRNDPGGPRFTKQLYLSLHKTPLHANDGEPG
jgi:hypothetical protein